MCAVGTHLRCGCPSHHSVPMYSARLGCTGGQVSSLGALSRWPSRAEMQVGPVVCFSSRNCESTVLTGYLSALTSACTEGCICCYSSLNARGMVMLARKATCQTTTWQQPGIFIPRSDRTLASYVC